MFTEWFSSFICLADVLACMLSLFCCFRLCATLCTVAHQAPLSMGFSRQQYWSGLPCSPPGNLPDPRIGPVYPAWQAFSLLLSHHGSPLSNPLISPSWSADPEHARPVSLCTISPALCLLPISTATALVQVLTIFHCRKVTLCVQSPTGNPSPTLLLLGVVIYLFNPHWVSNCQVPDTELCAYLWCLNLIMSVIYLKIIIPRGSGNKCCHSSDNVCCSWSSPLPLPSLHTSAIYIPPPSSLFPFTGGALSTSVP